MPRTARAIVGGTCYHVLNRGNAQKTVFHSEGDYWAFVQMLRQACEQVPMRVLAYCVMPNHFHLALWPHGDGDLSRWMHWLLTAHVRRYNQHYQSSGHVWQGRFKAFPIQQDDHLLIVLRYIERNPLRAGLVVRAEEWTWSSARERPAAPAPSLLTEPPVVCPPDWRQWVNRAMTDSELEQIRYSVRRGSPFGSEQWTTETAHKLGLAASLHSVGRPRKLDEA